MSTLTAGKFNTPQGADVALAKLEKLQGEMVINLHDAAVVSWEAGHKKPRTREMHDTTSSGAPGTSALFVLTSGAVYDKVAAEFHGTDAELIRTNLSDEQEANLREAFGLEE